MKIYEVTTAVILLAGVTRETGAFVPAIQKTNNLIGARTCIVSQANAKDEEASFGLNPTEKQKEQLEKFGATPETSMEMLFDKLVDSPDDGSDPMMNAFMNQPGQAGEEWKGFLSGLKEMKEKKKKEDSDGDVQEKSGSGNAQP